MFRQLYQITKFEKFFSYRKLSVLTFNQKCLKDTRMEQKNIFNNNLQEIIAIKYFCTEKLKYNKHIDELELRDIEKEKNENDAKEKELNNNKQKLKDLRIKILNASLPFVSKYGWNRHAIGKGAESIGYPGVVHGMFPNGGIELVQYLYIENNKKLVDHLKELLLMNNNDNNDKKNDVDKIPKNPSKFAQDAIKFRLILLEPYLTMWPQALALMSLPQNASTSLAHLLTLMDDICYYSGDRSVDFPWYIRRIGLASIYKMTELYMLQDKSLNYIKTWEFLERRIDDALFVNDFIDQTDKEPENVQKVLSNTFITARNILGIHYNDR